MEKELSIIDGILMNLAGVLRFYEFEHIQYTNLLHTLKNFQNETLSEPELKSSDKIFKDESNNEINNIEKKVKDLEQKIKEIRADISSRNQSKEKLISLFNALKSVDSIKSLSTSAAQNDDAVKTKEFDGVELPIMEIREELDDDDNIISTDIKPYQSSETQLKALFQNTEHLNTENQKTSVEKPKTPIAVEARLEKEEKQTGINKKQLESNNTVLEDSDNPNSANFLPFVIREEIDEDGNIIKSSMSRIPQMKPTDENDENDISNDLVIREPENEKDQIDEDQLTELFEDMGFTLPKVTDVTGDDNVKEDVEKLAESNISEDISKIPLKGDSDLASSTSNNLPTAHNVDPNDIYTLELIADELNQQECDEEREVNVEIDDDFEWPEIDDHDNDEEEEEDNDDDYDIQKRVFTNMFGGKVQNRFAQEIMNLRKHKSTSNETNEVVVHEVDNVIVEPEVAEIVEEITPVETLPKIENKAKKLKKSVSFNSTVDIKKVDDIWDDLRASNAENEINDLQNKSKKSSSSIFKRTRETVSSNSPVGRKEDLKEEEKKDVVISDVMERQIVESDPEPQPLPHHDVFKKFDSISLRKQLDDTMSQLEQKTNLTKISGKKGPSKFKLARAVEIGKKFQETHIPSEVREQLQTMADLIDKKENVQESNSQLTPVLKKNLNSLKPNKGKSTSQKSHKIETPVDINPLPVNPQSLADEDYEIVRNEASDGLFDDDDDIPEAEFVASEIKENEEIISDEYKEPSTKSKDDDVNEYFPVYTKKGETNKETEVVGTTLDYKMISDDLDTMAKAYVLGLYDDDIHTTGDVIEELDDFEKHNKVVEDIENSQLHERVTEINKKLEGEDGKIEEILEDDNPMVVSDIVENDMNDILEANDIPDDQLDIELNDENLATQVALDYTKMRSNMIHKYKGGFKETDKEKEFVRPEGSERVSRFKMARLGM